MKIKTMYQCKFTATSCAYASDFYDLKTDDEDEIRKTLKDCGYDVLEVYDIKKQR